MDRIFMILKIKLLPGVYQSLPWSYIHLYVHISQTSLLVYMYISNLRWEFTGPPVYMVLNVISKGQLAMGTIFFIFKVSNAEKVLKALFQ